MTTRRSPSVSTRARMRREACALTVALALGGAAFVAPFAVPFTAPLAVREAAALPPLGAARPSTRLVDAWDRTLELASLAGMPILVVYEDKGSAQDNIVMKRELAELAKSGAYKRAIALVAIADVGGYDYWPIRGFVKSSIREESAKFETVIYCDWKGEARSALALKPGVSNVVLYGKDGKVAFAHEGPMSAETRRALFDLLRAQLAK